METENGRFSGRQLRVIVACFLAYFCAYIGRLNMSATLGHVIEAMKVDETLGGTLQTVFAIVYASGQFIFGAMVDRVRPRILLSVGLIFFRSVRPDDCDVGAERAVPVHALDAHRAHARREL